MKIQKLTIALLLLATSMFAQKEVLFTVNKEPVTVDEFTRVYQKNINLVQDEKQKDVDEYLKLYVNYKLKLAEAKALGLDKDAKYLSEFKSYRSQLAQKYLTDTDVNEVLIKEAYQRIKEEVNINHILVRCPENALPADTLKAYNQVLAYKKQAQKEGFETIMKKVNNGKTVYGESLGYFDAFKMVYPFENVAYNTPVGEISDPFRTQFGYHILQVLDKRKSRGEVEVAHIMVANNNTKLTTTPKEKINEIYNQLKNGANFSNLAKQFSDDKGSAIKGGVLQRFGSGKITDKNFENTAFSLTQEGELSAPIQSKYGWHIIKLIKKYPVPELAKMKATILQKIKKDSRSKIVNDKFYGRLKKKYHYKEKENAVKEILKVVDQSFLGGRVTDKEKNKDELFSFANKNYTYADYYKYLRSKIRGYRNLRNIDKIVNDSFNEFVNQKLLAYQNENLENEYPDFAAIVKEYREGLLLFDLMEKQVWQKAKKDTLGVQKYYNAHKKDYLWDTRVDAIIVTAQSKKEAKKAKKILSKHSSVKAITNAIKNAVVSAGIYEKNDKELPSKIEFKKGVSKIFRHNKQYVVVKINEILLPKQKEFEEVRGRVINDYQNEIEKKWLQQLKTKYPVSIHNDVLAKVKKQL